MKGLTIRAMTKACGGSFHGSRELLDREVSSVSTDSRSIEPGALFVPIRGEKADGHDFISQVMEKGALVTLTERAEGMPDCPYILVGKTTEAIQQIAGLYRRSLGVKVVGITGSVGKTSTKEMIASVLSQRFRVLKTEGNLNNNLGLPLTIFRLTEEDEVAVLEMGISHFGEMTWLAETAEPDLMVITNIGECHLEYLKDRDGVFKAKTECFDYVKLDGTVILNGEDDKLRQVREVHGRRPVFYGLNPGFRVYAEEVRPLELSGSTFRLNVDEEAFDVTVPLPGSHMVLNALAGAAVGAAMGLTAEEIRAGIEHVRTISGRINIVETGGMTVIDDAYNASPMSMRASLGILADAPAPRVAILGDMGELGETALKLHREVGRSAGALPIDRYVLAGSLAEEMAAGILEVKADACVRRFATCDEVIEALPSLAGPGDTVLVKASHFMQFDRIVKALCGGAS